jgi:hypothetical protein
MKQPTYAQISALAYRLYVEDGKPHGEAQSHWYRALDILRHPENYSDDNILSPPSEPELTRALDEKGHVLDEQLPSNPASGSNAYHQRIEVALDARDKKAAARIKNTLRSFKGVEKVQTGETEGTAHIFFDARKTNPAAILEALSDAAEEAENAEVV